ncbi:MAG: C-type lectin domain-containing protein [Sandaracinaceae bacterium]|nr:C-type lectin domain-containing protein [Sandaracinaceae bacterium]
MSRVAAVLALALLAPGCILDRSGTAPSDGGASPFDSGSFDAALSDGGHDGGADGGLDAGDAAVEDACVPSAELCNGVDDDCDPTTADGADEGWLGIGCDGDDPDACPGGLLDCVGGAMVCVGDTPDGREELCDGVDNDCDVTTPDGADDPRVGMPCDGADLDRCEGGVYTCGATGLECPGDDEDAPDEIEVCDGVDNDCNPLTLDGASDPMMGMPCDDPADTDLCPEGAFACSGGARICAGDDGNQPDETELCDGMDNDCDPSTPDGSADTRVGSRCDGPDTDQCLEGMGTCSMGTFSCSDTTGSTTESCNGLDDDCNGIVDDGGADCGCTRRERMGHSYLFCNNWLDRKRWTNARDWCRGTGYDLVVVDDAAEQAWLDANVGDMGASYWIGANDRSTEGSWQWSRAGAAVTYSNWNSGEPNNSSNEDCAVLNPYDTGASGVGGGWNDTDCNDDNRYVCEAAP